MKKVIVFTLMLIATSSFAQEVVKKEKSHELKLNAFNILIFNSLSGSYEFLIDDESSVGISILINLNDDNSDGPNYNETFAITPYYRRFFSSKHAWGFFLEGFGMYNVQEVDNYDYSCIVGSTCSSDDEISNFALGISLGSKFVSKKGFTFEFYTGIGRNLFTTDSHNNTEFVPRLGALFGYRF